MLAERFTSSLVLSFWCLGEIFSAPVCQSLVLLCGVISCSHSMYNAYPKLYCLLHVCLPPHLNTHTRAHTSSPSLSTESNTQAFGTRMLYLATYKTNFIQIYDFWSWVISLNPQTGHNSWPLCVWYLLCFQIWEPQHSRRARGVVRRNPLYFQQPASYSALSTFGSWKRKERSGQLLLHPFLNYTVVIKQHTFNHSLC